MKRVILSVPAGLTLSALTLEQQAAIAAVFGQHVNPMPGTLVAGETQLVDAVTADNFDPAALAELGLPFEVLGLWQWRGVGAVEPLQALDEAAFLAHLAPQFDGDGAPLPIMLREPHRWSGWPDCFGEGAP